MCSLLVKKLTANAMLPTKAHANDAGHDLYSIERVEIPSWSRALIRTGIAVKIPQGCYGRIAGRSGLATKNCVDVAAGVVDINYRGELMVCLVNSSNVNFTVDIGSKIAQLVCEKIEYPTVTQVLELDSTERNQDGFGSSGV
jgi:dUTP pyrophosphatase